MTPRKEGRFTRSGFPFPYSLPNSQSVVTPKKSASTTTVSNVGRRSPLSYRPTMFRLSPHSSASTRREIRRRSRSCWSRRPKTFSVVTASPQLAVRQSSRTSVTRTAIPGSSAQYFITVYDHRDIVLLHGAPPIQIFSCYCRGRPGVRPLRPPRRTSVRAGHPAGPPSDFPEIYRPTLP